MEVLELFIVFAACAGGGVLTFFDNKKFGKFIGVSGLLRKRNLEVKRLGETLSYAQVHFEELPEHLKPEFKRREQAALSGRDQAVELMTREARTAEDLRRAGTLLERATLEANLLKDMAAESAVYPSLSNIEAQAARRSARPSANS